MANDFATEWDNLPEVRARVGIRYPGPDPEGVARAWKKIEEEKAAAKTLIQERPPTIFPGYENPVITLAAEEFDDPCQSLSGYVKLALANGWTLVTLSHSKAFLEGRAFESGQKAGIIRPDRDVEIQWAHFEKKGTGRAVVYFTLSDGKPKSSDAIRRLNGKRFSDSDMKKILKGTFDGRDDT